MKSDLFYRNTTSIVRTPRFAVLVARSEKNWKAYINGIIQSFSQTWGGEHFIIIPTDGRIIDETFWRILEAYNPDYIGRYIPSLLDLEEAEPVKYEKIKAHHKRAWKLPDDEFDQYWAEQCGSAHLGGLDIDDSLSMELKGRLSPFYFEDRVAKESVFHGSPLGYPFTEIEHIVESANGRPTEVFAPLVVEDESYRLLTLSRAGALSNRYAKTLEGKGITVRTLPDSSDAFRLADYVAALEGGEYDPSWEKAINDSDEEYPPEDFLTKLPFALSSLHLGKFYRSATHRHSEENTLVVIGDAMDDYCLYYALSRLHGGTYWLPDRHLVSAHKKTVSNEGLPSDQIVKWTESESIASMLIGKYYKYIRYGNGKKKIQITSMTLTSRQLANRLRYMASIGIHGDSIRQSCTVIAPNDVFVGCVMQVIEANNHANQQDIVFQNRQSIGRLNTPKPKNFSPVNAAEHRWITGMNVHGFHPPALPFLGQKILGGMNSVHETRIAKDEIAYFSPNIAYFGGDIDTITLRPTINLLSDDDIFTDYFADSGYTTELSDKGSYLKDAINRFGSLEQTALFFRNKPKRNLFDQYLVTRPESGDGEIVYLSAEHRAYISFKAFKRKLGSEREAIETIDELISKDIIYRGLIFQCSRCRLSAWYSISAVSSQFTCTRCALTQPYSHANWKSPAEPTWYYRLAETVYLFYESNSHITALALDRLRQEAPDEFHYVSETNIINPQSAKPKQEIDVLAIVKGGIILGECKNKGTTTASDVRKYLTIFSQLKIKPSQFLLATTESNISAGVRAELSKFKDYRVFTRKDLYE